MERLLLCFEERKRKILVVDTGSVVLQNNYKYCIQALFQPGCFIFLAMKREEVKCG